jgi:AcrR family transcriptional regulator
LLSLISIPCDDRQMEPQPDRPPSATRTARERARTEITQEILDAARGYLATDGAPALSLRAIARDLGMASSALYRYFDSRDALLTRLIIDAYDSLGAAAEASESVVDRADLTGRFTAICQAVRAWALAHPNEYALIYGSPVPGYVAPTDTVAPASRVTTLLMRILIDATTAGRIPASDTQAPEDPEVGTASAALAPIRSYLPPGVPAPLIQRGLMTWTGLFGVVSFELYGQLHQVIGEPPADRDAFFAECVHGWLQFMNLG